MAGKTKIEWATDTWNPIAGCSIVSPGCTNCYAMRMAARLEKMLPAERRGEAILPHHYSALTQPSKAGPVWTGRINLAPDHALTQPLHWKRPRRIFVNSMSDLFHEDVLDKWIDIVFAVMALCPQHTFQILTKRPERMRAYFENRRKNFGRASDVLLEMSHSLSEEAHQLAVDRIEAGYRRDDPTVGIKKYAGGEFHTWTDDQIAKFEAFWPIGTMERLAFALLLYTGQRRSDVVRMSWRDIKNNVIQVCQQKTGERVWIPVHPALMTILETAKKEHVSILTSGRNRAFTSASFGNWMAAKIGAAELPDECVTHGLRKAAARRLAEAGCSEKEIASVTGHKSLSEVERYTREADKKLLAQSAVLRLVNNGRTKDPNPKIRVGESSKNTNKINSILAGWRSREECRIAINSIP